MLGDCSLPNILVVCSCDCEEVGLKIDPDPDGSVDIAWVSKSKVEVVAAVAPGKAGTDVVAKMFNVV
jgi:hypothetical protein